jgi:hypothetical protein
MVPPFHPPRRAVTAPDVSALRPGASDHPDIPELLELISNHDENWRKLNLLSFGTFIYDWFNLRHILIFAQTGVVYVDIGAY